LECRPLDPTTGVVEGESIDEHGAVSAQKPLVLVVDDDAAVRNSLRFSLQVEGFAVSDFRDGNELLSQVELPRSDCLVVDYHLPGMSGLEVLNQLRERHVLVPAILITSHPSPNLRERAAAAGARIVEKPLLGDALIENVRDLLGRAPARA
jgi:two-component system, LuxR family, response regulator FixJ